MALQTGSWAQLRQQIRSLESQVSRFFATKTYSMIELIYERQRIYSIHIPNSLQLLPYQ